MGFSDIGPYGGEIATPNLDKLAASIKAQPTKTPNGGRKKKKTASEQ